MKKKLTDVEIAKFEAFAASIKYGQGLISKEDKFIADYVDRMKAIDWKGVRIEEDNTLEGCKARLEKLKKKYA